MSWDDVSSVQVTGWTPRYRVSIRDRGERFFLSKSAQTGSAAGPASYSAGTADSFPGGKRPECEDKQSPVCNVEVKNDWIYTTTPIYTFVRAQGRMFYFIVVVKIVIYKLYFNVPRSKSP
jgi:hypothetical protein